MTRKNKQDNRSRIIKTKLREVIKDYSIDLNASQIAKLTHLNLHTMNKILRRLRQRTCEWPQLQSAPLQGQIEADESYFGARRAKGKRGRGASGKTIVFGWLKRGGKVYLKQG